jgi:hypothetical protein
MHKRWKEGVVLGACSAVLVHGGFFACGGQTRVLGGAEPADSGGTAANGVDSGGKGGSGGSDGGLCAVSEQPPDRPAVGDPGTDLPPIVVAMRTIDFGEPFVSDGASHPFRDLGYDLDRNCTFTENNVLRNTSCLRPSFATAVTGCNPNYCGNLNDFQNGRDNSFARFIAEVSEKVAGFGSAAYSSQIDQGKVSLLWRVRGYNGRPNDDQVELTLLTPAAMANEPGNPRTTPEWDGLDIWPVAGDSLNLDANGQPDVNNPKFRDVNAYVSNGVIVGSFTQADLRLRIGVSATLVIELLLQFKQAFFTAELKQVPKVVASADGGTKTEVLWTMQNGRIAGRWFVNDLLRQLDQFPDPTALSKPLCMSSAAYPRFHDVVCSFVDICVSPTCSPTTPCDAISVGMGFEAEQAILGDIYQLQPLQDRCPDDPGEDDCFNPIGDGGLIDGGSDGSGGSSDSGTAGAAGAAGGAP